MTKQLRLAAENNLVLRRVAGTTQTKLKCRCHETELNNLFSDCEIGLQINFKLNFDLQIGCRLIRWIVFVQVADKIKSNNNPVLV